MRELYIQVAPTIFNYSGAIIENGLLEEELTNIPMGLTNLQKYVIDQNIDTIVLCGNSNYTKGLKQNLEKLNTQFNKQIKIRTEEVKN